MTDKINEFLRETELENLNADTWGIRTFIKRAGAKPVMLLMSLKSATDQFVVPRTCDSIIPEIADTIGKISVAVKDPAIFDVPNASLAALMCHAFFGRMGKPCLVLVSVRAASNASTHVILEGYSIGVRNIARAYVKDIRCAIESRFP